MLQALLSEGIDRAYAVELVADATWKVYEVWGRIGRIVARLRPRGSPEFTFTQTRPDGTFGLTFPFESPGYLVRPVPAESGLAFDVVRCPVAEYFRARGDVDLCRSAWCDLDYALGEMQGRTLRRTKTLVEGADCCDFRIEAHEAHLACPPAPRGSENGARHPL
jgi:hypothetical protein